MLVEVCLDCGFVGREKSYRESRKYSNIHIARDMHAYNEFSGTMRSDLVVLE